MARALITGVDGFTGRHLRGELESAGHEVYGLTHAGGEASARVTPCELRDVEAVRAAVASAAPQYVAHLAAVSHVAHGDAAELYGANVVGTRNLLAALAELPDKPRAVLLASSANVYGNASGGVIDEDVPPAPANDYAVSKLAMEWMASCWAQKLPLRVVRPFNYTGVGQSPKFLIPKIVEHLRRREPVIELGNLDVERDFSDVRFVVEVYRRLLEAEAVEGELRGPLNVCSGRGTTLRQLLAMGSELTGHSLEVRVNPAFVRENEVHKLVGGRSALERAIGPVAPVPLRETLSWMLGAR